VALACSVGLHWSLLQSVAWTSMLVDNLATASVSGAIQRTFDGKHPCALCKAIARGRQSEKKSDRLLSLKKFEAMNQAVTIFVSPPASFPRIAAREELLANLAHAPPTPPPRAA
jgi:hypothetical protein